MANGHREGAVRLAILLLAIPAFGQFSITVSQLGDELPKYLVGAVPKTIRAFSSLTCNVGPGSAELAPDMVIHALMARGYAVQPGQDVIDAVRAYKGGKGRVIAYNFGLAGMHLVPALGFLAGPVEDRRDQLRNFNTPENWWIAGKPSVLLGPNRCLELKFGVYGDVPKPEPIPLGQLSPVGIAPAVINTPVYAMPYMGEENGWLQDSIPAVAYLPSASPSLLSGFTTGCSSSPCGLVCCHLSVQAAPAIGIVTRTHPQVEDEPDARSLLIAAMIRERTANCQGACE